MMGMVVVVGCGSESQVPRSPEETIAAWVSAVNEGDWGRACELSIWPDDHPLGCEDAVRRGMQGMRPMEVVRPLHPDDERHRFSVAPSSSETPSSGFELERQGDVYLVHFEVQIVR